MWLELDKKALVSLVNGTSPHISIFDHPLVKKCGSFCGGFVEQWNWNSGLETLTEKELYELYILCINSWNK